jgi:hypothetical protein
VTLAFGALFALSQIDWGFIRSERDPGDVLT